MTDTSIDPMNTKSSSQLKSTPLEKDKQKQQNRTASLPLYVQIAELLKREIAAGYWRAGDRLPVESELAKSLNASIGTLRKALNLLENDGLLSRVQGSGTYVSALKQETALYQFFHLERLNGSGLPTAEIIALDVCKSDAMADIFEVCDKAVFWRIRRRRSLDNVAVAAEEIWIKHKHQPTLDQDSISESLYAHYREHFDFWISRVEDKISCQAMPDWAAQLLDLSSDAPSSSPPIMGWVTRRGWSQHQIIEEYSQTWFNPALCQYTARWS